MLSYDILTTAATSDLGRKRKNNEDCFGYFFPNRMASTGGSEHIVRRHEEQVDDKPKDADKLGTKGTLPDAAPELLTVVCDGMGGAEGGEVASALGVETVGQWFRSYCDKTETDVAPASPDAPTQEIALAPSPAVLAAATLAADKAVWDAALADEKLHGMGATLSALWIANGHYAIAQVGDSRIYLWRDGVLTQLTEDQTVLNSLKKDGKMPENPAIASRFKSTLEQALGSEPGLLKPETQTGELHDGDLYILCSDGLYDGIDGDALAAFLKRHAGRLPLQELSDRLVRESVERSGRDNTTAVLVAVGDLRPTGGFFGRFL
jgi:protein phosphatase